MAHPKTYMMVKPDPRIVGTAISSVDLVAGLLRANPSFVIPMPDSYPGWYPGKGAGMTCIWLGQPPPAKGGKKICGFHLGRVPEYTELGLDGTIRKRGWRAIFERVMVSGTVQKHKLEEIFRVRLEYDGTTPWCQACARTGKWVASNSPAGLCLTHEAARVAVATQRDVGTEIKYQQKKEGIDPNAPLI